MIASSLGRFLRGVAIPSDFGSIFTTSASMCGLCHTPEAACHLITEVWFDVQRNHMAHPATYPLNAAALATRTEVQARAIPWYVWCCAAAVTSSAVGGVWDISWHESIGRDTFWTPAHVLIYLCGVLAGVACG